MTVSAYVSTMERRQGMVAAGTHHDLQKHGGEEEDDCMIITPESDGPHDQDHWESASDYEYMVIADTYLATVRTFRV